MKVRLSSEIRRYLTVCLDLCGNQISASLPSTRHQPNSLLDFHTDRDKAWLFFLAFMGPRALSSCLACKAWRCARSALATAARRAWASWNNFSCSAFAFASSRARFFSATLCGNQNLTSC